MKIFLFLTSILLSTKSAKADEISFADYIDLIKNRDSEYKALLLELEKNEYFKDQNIAADPLTLNADVENSLSGNFLSSSVGASKELSSSGTTFSAEATGRLSSPEDSGSISLSASQSLYRNFFGSLYGLELSAAHFLQKSQNLKTKEKIESYLTSKMDEYLDFVKLHLDVELATTALEQAKKLKRNVDARLKKSAANKTDANRAKLQLLLAEEALLIAKDAFDQVRKKILTPLGLQTATSFPQKSLDLQDIFQLKSGGIPTESLREYQALTFEQKASDEEKKLSKRKLLPELAAFATYRESSSDTGANFSSEEGATVGLTLSMTIGDTQASAAFEAASIGANVKTERLKALLSRLNYEKIHMESKLENLKKRLTINRQKVSLIKRIYEDELKRYGTGRREIDTIIQINGDYARYQTEYNKNSVDFNKVYLKWLSFNDQLIQ